MIAEHELVPLPSPPDGGEPVDRLGLVGALAAPLGALRVRRLRRRRRADLRRLLQLGACLIDDVGQGLGEAVDEAREPY